ncbi:hypothetical protein LTR91_009537 [Friedmanniomyces endolithicus]|uniref:Peptidase A1 domain-containing protein n=1 Tax=Friedmanniomyces endolithicus TaxID=329885 RepID=A0AAN6KLA4_9PEZI|nr:hypothetical protein LTS01_017514 [Friedmanniomyces endolithicus]KAK0988651.1 hypothetical protein LTR91_009537 [Friedmanniomyces endolithicus]KAK1027204.1 hypothetical protein LTS16_021676 [Friedmanniomyces endolithicus]
MVFFAGFPYASCLPTLLLLLLVSAHTSTAASFTTPWLRDVPLVATGLIKRAQNTTTIPAPIVVAPSQYWDGIDGPWSSFALQVGTPAQNVRVQISTASTFTWTIYDGGCPPGYVTDCANSRGFLFETNKSLTWTPNSIFNFDFEVNLNMDTTGNAGFDTATLGWQGAGGPTVSHSTIFSIKSSTYWLGGFGLNPRPTNFSTFVDPQPSFMQQLKTNNTIPSISYGYTAGNQYHQTPIFGSLVLGGYDQNRFTPTNVSFPFFTDISRDLLVRIHSISTNTSFNLASSNLLPSGPISAFVDSTVPTMWLPIDACEAFEAAFNLQYNEALNMYLVNDTLHQQLLATSAAITFTLTAGDGRTVPITLPYGAFDLTLHYPYITSPNTSYYFPLQRANNTQYTLGRAFLQEAYLIVDYERQNFTIAPCAYDNFNPSNADIRTILSPDTVLPNSRRSRFPTGAIAGVIVGIVILIAALAAILWFLRRRKHTEKRRVAELEAKEAGGAHADHSSENESKPFISNPIGGELGGGEIHELTAPHKPFAQEMESPHKIDPNKAGYSEMESGEYFGPGKGFAHEMHGSGPDVFEMPGSDVHEMPGHGEGHGLK